MKIFILFFCTLNVGYSLKCYLCVSLNANGEKVECEPVEQTCDATFYFNGTSCATITYELSENSATYRGCYFKMKEPEGTISYSVGSFNIASTYKSCDEDLCNGSESFKKNFNVLAITGVLYIFSQLF